MEENNKAKQEDAKIGFIRELGELPPGAVVTEQGLAKFFGRHKVSIKRAIERGELPPGVRLLGEQVWTVKSLQEHLGRRLEQAKKESEQLQKKINKFNEFSS